MTKFTDIALRIAMHLLAADETGTLTAKQVADEVGAPRSHVAKVVSRLTSLGVLRTKRGPGGGLTLTERGRDASVGWLVRELEGSGDPVGCEDPVPCRLRGSCRLRIALLQAQEAFYSALDPITVADLAGVPDNGLIPLLGPHQPEHRVPG